MLNLIWKYSLWNIRWRLSMFNLRWKSSLRNIRWKLSMFNLRWKLSSEISVNSHTKKFPHIGHRTQQSDWPTIDGVWQAAQELRPPMPQASQVSAIRSLRGKHTLRKSRMKRKRAKVYLSTENMKKVFLWEKQNFSAD